MACSVLDERLTYSPQAAKKLFDDALGGEDVEENEKGEVALHGVTYLAWASKVPS